MRHPDEARLALYAGGDLGFFERFRIRGHIGSCAACKGSVEAYRHSRQTLRAESAHLPEGLNWDRLAAEMTGNIRVGLAAGECVGSTAPVRGRHLTWKPVAAFAALSVVMASAWWLNFPVEQRDNLSRGVERIWSRDARNKAVAEAGVYLEMNRAGIQFRENGSAMTMKRPSSVSEQTPVVVSVSTLGSMGASYIDSDTGQVTINNVIAQ